MTDGENKQGVIECPHPGETGKGKCDGYQVFRYEGRARCVWRQDDGSCKLSRAVRMVGADRGAFEKQKERQAEAGGGDG